MGFNDEEIVAALQGMLAECDGHNYGNLGASTRIWNPTQTDLDARVQKDPAKIAAMLQESIPLADTKPDGTPYVGQDWASLGIYQQIPSGIYGWGWGSVAELMDPAMAARKFYEALGNTTQLQGEPMYFRVQKVQRSQFDGVSINPSTGKPYPFADNYRVRLSTARLLLADPLYFMNGGKSVIDQ